MKLALPDTIASREDLAAVIQEARTYASYLQQTSVAERVGAKRRTDRPDLSPSAISILTAYADKKTLTLPLVEQLIRDLEAFQRTAQTVTITLAAPVTSEVRSTLVTWLRQQIADDLFVTFAFNSTLLGGMVVRCGSRIFDWSFRRTIMNERHEIGEVLRHV